MTLLLLACANASIDDTGTAPAGLVTLEFTLDEADGAEFSYDAGEVPIAAMCCDEDRCVNLGKITLHPDGSGHVSCGGFDRAEVTLLR